MAAVEVVMSTRILIQLDNKDPSSELPENIRGALEQAGVTDIRSSHRELPGLFTAVVPDQSDVQHVLAAVKALPGVRHAEADTFRSTF
jgi:hypothetical protein